MALSAPSRRAQREGSRVAKPADPAVPATGKKKKGPVREWLDALVFAVVVMLIVRGLFVDLFRIPTPSMEDNLLVGDFLFVSKVHYGVRTPHSIGIPFTSIHIPGLELNSRRLPGFSEVKRGDAVVFNWPADGDKPADRKQHYIKRFIGMPGETLELRNGVTYINGQALPEIPRLLHYHVVYGKDPAVMLSATNLRNLGAKDVRPFGAPGIVLVNGTDEVLAQIAALPYVDRVERYRQPQPEPPTSPAALYPATAGYTPQDYGPVLIPKAGETVAFTPENLPYLLPALQRYEGVRVEQQGDVVLIDGQPATSYTFRQDYFFAMGDNRDDSQDSRFWGFVPMDHVVGKAFLVYFAWNPSKGFPIRFERIGRPVRSYFDSP